MDHIPEDLYLKYNTSTLITLRKSYNLDGPRQMDEAVDILQAWVNKQEHFVKKDFPRDYLERVIIMLKGSIERAKGQLENLCTLRTLLPHFFEKIDAKKDFSLVSNYFSISLMPRLTEENQRMQLMRLKPNPELSHKAFFMMYTYSILTFEYMKAHDYSDGIMSLVDLRDINIMDFVTRINLNELKQMSTITLEGYATRAKKFVLISSSSTIDVLIKLLRQLLPEKLRKRIFVVKNLEGLHEQVPKHLLPADYGGDENSLDDLHDELQEAMASEINIAHLKEMSYARTNETLRITSKITDELLGIAGSFRTLSFD